MSKRWLQVRRKHTYGTGTGKASDFMTDKRFIGGVFKAHLKSGQGKKNKKRKP